jgi:hypothetical protein
MLPVVLVTALVAAGVAVTALITTQDLPAVLRRLGPVALVGLGASMMLAGAGRRVGRAEHCAACDYEKRPGGGSGAVCPECGADWNRPGGTRRGRRVRNRILFWGGLAIMVAYLAGPLSALLVGRSVHLKLVPTSVLIDRISGDGSARAEWDELRSRALSPRQQARLTRRLLEKRRSGIPLSRHERAWLDARITDP